MNANDAKSALFLLTTRGLKRRMVSLPLFLLPLFVSAQAPISIGFPDSSLYYCIVGLPKVPELKLQLSLPVSPQFIKTSAIAVAGISLWAVAYEHVDEPMREAGIRYNSSVATNAANIFEPLGRQKYLAPFAGLVFIGGIAAQDNKLMKAGLLATGSILTNAVATHTLKRAFQRHRPSATDENDLFDGPLQATRNRSFPSYHTSTAFAVASSFALVYRDYKYIPPIAYGLATLVGLSRIQHNAHWATDVLAGAVVGYMSTIGVNYLYTLTNNQLKARKKTLLILPSMYPQYTGFSATLTF
ncbi:PA-phosphatase like phosphoesterase [Flammeovirgaceae bacterium 311]|nr:PA-phosphatase like phosphoesterase [Flammeovirgaceae bacterium 311]